MEAVTLIEYLRARLDEDEARAKRAAAANEQARDDDGPTLGHAEDYLGEALAVHIWRYSPKRVLAEVEAKRRIMELHAPVRRTVEWWDSPDDTGEADTCPSCRPDEPTEGGYDPGVKPAGFVPSYTLAPCPTLRLLALPYWDHVDYSEDWKP